MQVTARLGAFKTSMLQDVEAGRTIELEVLVGAPPKVKARLEQTLATEFPSVVGRVYPLELGPPVGWPLQYRVSGRDPEQVRAIAYKVAQEIGSAPGARNVNYNWMEPARTVRIKVDQDEARLLGLSSQDLANSLNTVLSGVTATQMRSGIYFVDVLVRASPEQRMSLSTIRTLQVPLPDGKTVVNETR